MATSKKNACVSLVFSFLYKIIQVGTRSFSFFPLVCFSLSLSLSRSLSLGPFDRAFQAVAFHFKVDTTQALDGDVSCPTQVFSEYFKELEEESIRDNFVIIYELMDELMDFGYPQTTDSKILQE